MPEMSVGGRQAKVGEGEWRVGVHIDNWERVKNRIEKTSPKGMGGRDPAVAGYCRAGYFRADVKIPLFEEFIKTLEAKG